MPVIIEANYAKKVGLPAYSSHQFSVTLRTELVDLSALEKTAAELYGRLQAAVDGQITKPGLVPSPDGDRFVPTVPENTVVVERRGDEQTWRCSVKQRDLILKIVDEHQLDKAGVEALAQQRFGAGVRQLNKLQASSFIDELLETHGSRGDPRRGTRRAYPGRVR